MCMRPPTALVRLSLLAASAAEGAQASAVLLGDMAIAASVTKHAQISAG